MNKRKKAACVERSMRSTGMEAYTDARLYSIKERKELFPARSSRTGNHREITWFLLPGKYWEARASISNSGKGGWSVSVLCVDENLTETHEAAPVPEWLRPLLPTDAIDFLEETFMTAAFENREQFGAFFSRMCGTCGNYGEVNREGCTQFGKVFELAESPPDEWVVGENELPRCTLWTSKGKNGSNGIGAFIAETVETAEAIKSVIDTQKLFHVIHNRKYITVEGWQFTIEAMGATAAMEFTTETKTGFEAKGSLFDKDGNLLSEASMRCDRDEKGKNNWDDFALLSMAQTRVIGKLGRSKYAYLVKMAGYEGTPAEEMD